MRIAAVIVMLIVLVGLGLVCTSHNRDSAAREVGRQAAELKLDAERAARKAGQAARKAGRELKKAGEQVREGWYQAQREKQPNDKR